MHTNPPSKNLVLRCAKAAIDKKANHTLIYNVGEKGAFTDYFLITSGMSERQVQAIADEIIRTSSKNSHSRVEGYEFGRWVLIDFGDVVVHIFHDYIREFYDLESLWGDSQRLPIPEDYYTAPSEHAL